VFLDKYDVNVFYVLCISCLIVVKCGALQLHYMTRNESILFIPPLHSVVISRGTYAYMSPPVLYFFGARSEVKRVLYAITVAT
jgi:hypothetical protein